MTLEQAKQNAQRAADRSGKVHSVINLNPYSPMYVIREGARDHAFDVPFVAYPKSAAKVAS